MTALTHDDALTDFEKRSIELNGICKTVYVSGGGPAVIVMHEMPGISPHVARFARWVRDAGFTVFMPSLFGRDGAIGTADEGGAVFRAACVSAEFRVLAGQGSSPVTAWLRGLARHAHEECGGPGVGAVGMCFTGNFALSMMLEPSVIAPILSQPTLPIDNPAAIESPKEEANAVRARLENENLTVLGYRFEGDAFCRAERFATYSKALGQRFIGKVLPDGAANDDVPPFFAQHVSTPHSVLTAHLRDAEGEPTIAARDEIIGFLKLRLLASAPRQ
jgi:dienelactone hydrolase